MKKLNYIILITAAVMAFSCTREAELQETQTQTQTGELVTIRVSTPEAIETKVSLTEAGDKKAMNLAWEDTDQLSVNGGLFSVTNVISDHEAEFEGPTPEGSTFTVIYPGTYTSSEAFNARSYAAQTQTGNSSTAHLEYNAMLSGVTAYAEPKFDPTWATDNGGSLVQNGAIQLRLQLPEGTSTATSVKLVASRAVFPTTNGGGEKATTQTLSLSSITLPSNRILEAYMMFSAAGVTWQAGDKLIVAVDTPEGMCYRTLPDMTAQTWTGGSQYTIQCKVNANSFVINDADDLEEFRDGVNSGDFLWQSCKVTLGSDIDCSGIASWTPIGNGTFTPVESGAVSAEWTEPAFKGIFDGNSHSINNLVMTASPDTYAPYGLFGILYKATVKNLTLGAVSGDSGALNATPVGRMDAGAVAGVAYGATVQNVTNYFPMTIPDNSSANRVAMGMVGYVYGDLESGVSILSNLNNYGAVSATQADANTGNGATSVHVAGVAGFSNSGDVSIINQISGCTNYAAVEANTGRCAGILAANNARTQINGCINRGSVLNTFSNARIAGICVILGVGSSMNDCSNYGNVIATQSNTQLGGLACLINNNNVVINGGGNHGQILGDITSYKGTLIANMSQFNAVSNLTAGGAYGTYNGGDYQYSLLTSENYMGYIGKISNGNENKVTNITFEAWDGYPAANETLISNATQLLAFAAKVNNGEFASTDIAKLTADIDCSSISSWTPIGNGAMSTWSATALTATGAAFAGTFDGQGHCITNLDMDFASAGSYGAYGFFGIIGDGATVKNLTFANSCSMNVSASYGSCFGVLAGIVEGATIQNVNNYAPITGGGTASLGNNNAAGRTMVGAIIGEVHPNTVAANLSSLHNYADIGSSSAEFSRGNNPGNGGNGFEVGGIAGFSTTSTTSLLSIFTDCVNDGNIYTNAGRVSGIVAGCNRYTKLENCTNNGNITSSVSGTYRLGNITCIAGEGSVLDGCVNKGNLTALNCVSVAGVVCLVNHATVQIKNCASLGATILGNSVNISGNQTYNGVLFGLCNNAATFSGCSINGYFGTSDSNKVALTAENYFQFVGQRGASCGDSCNTTNITFAP